MRAKINVRIQHSQFESLARGKNRKKVGKWKSQTIVRKMTKPGTTYRSLARKLRVAHMTVFRHAKKGKLKAYKYPVKFLVTENQQNQRYCYAEEMLRADWRRKTFLDEKTFYLGHASNRQNSRVFATQENKHKIKPIRKSKHAVKVNMMAAVNYLGKSEIFWFFNESKYESSLNIF